MAIIKLAAPLAGIRGTVGGLIYSANKAGPYCRAWSRPPNQRTAYQTEQRSILAAAAGAWRDIAAGDRADWDTWAADPDQELTNSLGEAYYISGFLWFVKLNTRLERVGRAWIDVCPAGARPAAPFPTYVVVTESVDGGLAKTMWASGTQDGYDIVIHAAVTQGAGLLNAFTGFYEVLVTQAPDLITEWWSVGMRLKLGYAIAGNQYHCRLFRQTDEGLRSAAGTKSTIAV